VSAADARNRLRSARWLKKAEPFFKVLDGACLFASSLQPVTRIRRDFDFAGGKLFVDRPLGPRAHLPRDANAELTSQGFRLLVGAARGLGVEHDLDETGHVAQIDEDDSPVIPASVDPAAQRDRGSDIFGSKVTTAVRAQHL
jgi:hypothetical protein